MHSSLGRQRPSRFRLGVVLLVVVVLAVAAIVVGVVQLLRPVPAPAISASLGSSEQLGSGRAALPLPSAGSGTVAVQGIGTLAETGASREYPIASVTKLMTALLVLKDHPLKSGSSGPSITVTASDVSIYQSDRAQGDSVVRVAAGERLTELQALEAMLLPSADNVATILADWDAGSLKGFVAKMNAEAGRLGLGHTHYADASGVDPASRSSAADQLKVAELVMRNAVLRRIVSMPQVTLPVAGVQYNVDSDLGHNGIVGIKTGWVPAGGASFVFAGIAHVGTRPVTVIGDVLGQQSATPLATALADATRLVTAAPSVLREMTVVRPGERVGSVSAPYSQTVPIVTETSAKLLAWPGAEASLSLRLKAHVSAPLASGTKVGVLTVRLGSERASVPVVTAGRLSGSTLSWRLTRP